MAVRPSLAYFPSDNALLDSSGLPWGVAVTPFSSTDERGSPPVTGDEGDLIPRCTSCFAYFSTLCSLHRWSWTCPICSEDNDLSAEAAARYARDGSHDPPELRSAFVDLLLPGRLPQCRSGAMWCSEMTDLCFFFQGRRVRQRLRRRPCTWQRSTYPVRCDDLQIFRLMVLAYLWYPRLRLLTKE